MTHRNRRRMETAQFCVSSILVLQTDAVERNQIPLSLVGADGFEFTIHPHEIVTVRMIGKDIYRVARK